MPGHGEKATRKQEAAVAALLTCSTIKAAAEQAGVSEKTLRTWLKEDAGFMAAYRAARRQVVEAAIGRLQQATGKAVTALKRNLRCGQAPSEIRAALGILEHSIKAVELVDILERLEALEHAADEGGQRK